MSNDLRLAHPASAPYAIASGGAIRRVSASFALVLVTLVACQAPSDAPAAGETPGAAAAQGEGGDFASVGLTGAAEPLSGLVTAAQPSPDQVQELQELGYERFISLRPATESGAGWEEEALPVGSFSRIPISGAADLTRANVEALDELLSDAGGAKTVLYCASSNRVGALLALRSYWLEGAESETALELGRSAGLAGLEPAVREIMAEGR